MAQVPSGQKFHTVPSNVQTEEKGSKLANSQREIFTMQDITDTVSEVIPLYKVYTAILNQSGTNAPIATVLENTIDTSLFWEYTSVGQYVLKLPSFPNPGPFTVGKTFILIGSATNSSVPLYANNTTSQGDAQNFAVIVRNYDTSFVGVDNFKNVSIEIRVYP